VTLAYNVSELLKSAIGSDRQVPIDEPSPSLGPDLTVTGPVRGAARLHRTQNGVLVRASLTTTIQLECSRCLEPLEREIRVDVEEEFRPSIHIVTGAPIDAPEDDALRIDERHVLDMTETVRQYVETALPLQPLCAPTCQGLCVVCGTNLNTGACVCATESPGASGPFAALAGLMENDQDAQTRAG
jgi:uncharacterized protein